MLCLAQRTIAADAPSALSPLPSHSAIAASDSVSLLTTLVLAAVKRLVYKGRFVSGNTYHCRRCAQCPQPPPLAQRHRLHGLLVTLALEALKRFGLAVLTRLALGALSSRPYLPCA